MTTAGVHTHDLDDLETKMKLKPAVNRMNIPDQVTKAMF